MKIDNRDQIFVDLLDYVQDLTNAERVELAEQAGVHQMTLYFWCSGKTVAPRINTLCRVAYALGLELTLVRRKAKLRRAA